MTPSRRTFLRRTGSILSALLCAAPELRARSASTLEYRVKAAFLFNFAKFVYWPPNLFASAATPIVIGIFGDDPFGADLDQAVIDKTIDGRPVRIRRFARGEVPGACQVLFFSAREKDQWLRLRGQLENRPILTVGDAAEFTREGGIINFIQVENHIRFEINPDAAQRAHLKLNSKLLQLARIVR